MAKTDSKFALWMKEEEGQINSTLEAETQAYGLAAEAYYLLRWGGKPSPELLEELEKSPRAREIIYKSITEVEEGIKDAYPDAVNRRRKRKS